MAFGLVGTLSSKIKHLFQTLIIWMRIVGLVKVGIYYSLCIMTLQLKLDKKKKGQFCSVTTPYLPKTPPT